MPAWGWELFPPVVPHFLSQRQVNMARGRMCLPSGSPGCYPQFINPIILLFCWRGCGSAVLGRLGAMELSFGAPVLVPSYPLCSCTGMWLQGQAKPPAFSEPLQILWDGDVAWRHAVFGLETGIVVGVTACVLCGKAGNAPCLKCIQSRRVPERDIPCRGILYII